MSGHEAVVIELTTSPVVVDLETTAVAVHVSGTTHVDITTVSSDVTIELVNEPTTCIEVGIQGIAGPIGPTGPVGPIGPVGPAGAAGTIDVAANCLSGDAVDDLVFISGPPIAGALQVEKIDIDDGAKMPGVGVIIAKSSPTDCIVRMSGEHDISTNTLTPGNIVYASESGTLTTTPPPRPSLSNSRYIQRIGIALTTTKLVVLPQTIVHEILP